MLKRRQLLGLPALMGPISAQAAAAQLQAFAHALPPLAFEQDGQLTGLAVDLLRRMASTLGMQLELLLQPRLRAEKSFQDAPESLLFPLARLPEREGRFRWVGPYMPRRVALFRLRSRGDIRYRGLQQLDGMRIGVTSGTATLEQLLAAGLKPGQDLELAPSYDANVRKLLAGRMDLLAIGELNLFWQLRLMQESPERVKAVAVLDESADYCFGLHPEADPALAAKLQQAFDQLQRNGTVSALKRSYGLPVDD
ncbi:substrate-binding periplasmic protein [Paucibacter soli]|uniref:substrate-binding periplasmic protein n=1 Tax=Paucibacter soli TaxID=3133433 RepID=UPI00309E5DFC